LIRPVRDVAVVAVALALGGSTVWLLTSCGGSGAVQSSTTQSRSRSQSRSDARAVAAARHFLDRYVARDGRVVRIDQGGDTVGEGQAYGMLLAAAIGDSQRFDTVWAWTQNHLQRPDGLISFLWRDGRVVDPQAASDADLDASRALLLAACRFHRPALRQQALHLGNAILQVEVASLQGAPVLTAGPWAVAPPITLNPSYFSPAAYAALGAASGDNRWAGLTASSRSITSKLMSGSSRLPPDWAKIEGGKPVPIGSPSEPQLRPEFSFDAVRTLVRMAEDRGPVGSSAIAARAWPVFSGQDPSTLPVQHALSGRPIGHVLHPVVLVAAAGAADAAGQPADRDGLLDEAEALDRRSPTYYGAAWVALGRIMLTTELLNACS
jgi:endo-1,4-beta-D-glucanase Y